MYWRYYALAVSARAERWLFEAKARGDIVLVDNPISSSRDGATPEL